MENDAEKIFTDLKEDISTYAGLKLRLLKLMAVERAANILSALSHGLIIMLFIFFTILFIFIALGFFLGDLLGNIALGFLIVGGIYFLLTIVFVMAKKGIRTHLVNIIIDALQTDNDEDEDDNENQATNAAGATDSRETGSTAAMSDDRSENER